MATPVIRWLAGVFSYTEFINKTIKKHCGFIPNKQDVFDWFVQKTGPWGTLRIDKLDSMSDTALPVICLTYKRLPDLHSCLFFFSKTHHPFPTARLPTLSSLLSLSSLISHSLGVLRSQKTCESFSGALPAMRPSSYSTINVWQPLLTVLPSWSVTEYYCSGKEMCKVTDSKQGF